MKFLLIASYSESLVNFRGPLLDALLSKGFTVHIAAPDMPASNTMRQHLEAKGMNVHDIPMHRTGMNPLVDLNTVLQLWLLMRRIQPDVTLGYTIKPVIYGSLAGFLSRVPKRFALITGLGYTFQGQDTGGKNRRGLRSLVQGMYAVGLRCAHKVLFQNPDDQALFRSLGILKPTIPSFVVNGSGVDVAKYCSVGLPDAPHFLLIARLLGDKGIREYVSAAQRIKKTHPEALFSLVGWIDENPDSITQEELDSWIEQGAIQYLGKLNDVRSAIAASSVYVLPSYREGTPRTVLEAMAMGRAIITTDAPGCRETVIDGENGFLVPVKDVDKLVVAMQRFIQDTDLISSMGTCSRNIAEEKYDVHKVNASMLQHMGIV